MLFVMITGPLGVGKSTLAHGLSRATDEKSAVVDGDHLAMTWPGGAERARLDLVENNLLSCAKNFHDWGAVYVFASWVFESERRYNLFAEQVRRRNWEFLGIGLHADDDVLLRRLLARKNQPFAPSPDNIDWIKRLNKRTRSFSNCRQIDTSALSEAAVLYRAKVLLDEGVRTRKGNPDDDSDSGFWSFLKSSDQ